VDRTPQQSAAARLCNLSTNHKMWLSRGSRNTIYWCYDIQVQHTALNAKGSDAAGDKNTKGTTLEKKMVPGTEILTLAGQSSVACRATWGFGIFLKALFFCGAGVSSCKAAMPCLA
jgi:hypothetical protein